MACVSQEYDEEPSQHIARAPEIGDRIVRVEALVAELVKKVGGAPGSSPWSEGMMSSRPRTPPADDVVFPGPTLLTPDDSASESGPQSMYCDDTSAVSDYRAAFQPSFASKGNLGVIALLPIGCWARPVSQGAGSHW